MRRAENLLATTIHGAPEIEHVPPSEIRCFGQPAQRLPRILIGRSNGYEEWMNLVEYLLGFRHLPAHKMETKRLEKRLRANDVLRCHKRCPPQHGGSRLV